MLKFFEIVQVPGKNEEDLCEGTQSSDHTRQDNQGSRAGTKVTSCYFLITAEQ